MTKILVVEDDAKVSKAYEIRLKSLGFDVVTASDAATAEARARKEQPDVILLDVFISLGDGFTVAERLQQHVETADTPVIFATASKERGLKERADGLGAVSFLRKPFDASALLEAIAAALVVRTA